MPNLEAMSNTLVAVGSSPRSFGVEGVEDLSSLI